MKLHTLVQHQKGNTLTKDHNSAIYFDKIIPLSNFEDSLCAYFRGVNICDKSLTFAITSLSPQGANTTLRYNT